MIQFFNAYSYRSDRLSVFRRPFANRWLNLSIVWETILLVVIVYVPWFHGPFKTYALSGADWVIVLSVALTIVPVLEMAKWMQRRGWFGELL